jgi:hypothetical protein
MALIQSGQKNLDEIQRIRVALEVNSSVVTGAQRELINKYAALLGEDGKAMIEDIEEEAKKPGKLPVDVFRLIDGCLHSMGQRAKKQDLSNEVIKQREPERLMQVEAIRSTQPGSLVPGSMETMPLWRASGRQHWCWWGSSWRLWTKIRMMVWISTQPEHGKTRCTRLWSRQSSTSLQRAAVGAAWDRLYPRGQWTA